MEFNSLKELGAYLREQREKKGISREEVAFSIKIGSRTLQALEEGDESKLPTKTYLRGFIQNYAKFLGLNVNEVMDVFQKIMGTTRPQPTITPVATPEATKEIVRKPIGDLKRLFTVAAILALIIITFLLDRAFKQREASQNGPVEVVTAESSPLPIGRASPSPTVSSTEAASGTTAASATPGTSQPTEAETSIAKATPTPTPASVVHATPKPVPTPVVKAPTASSAETTATGEKTPQEIIVEALDSVKLTVQIDNQAAKNISLRIDQIQTFRAKGSIKLSISNAGVVNVIHNGVDLGVPGNTGQPISLSFP